MLQQGGQRVADSGGAVYSPAARPDSLVLTGEVGAAEEGTGGQRRAWALYRFDNLLDERPQRLRIDVAEAAATAGGSPVALAFYVGIADRSQGRWEWHGPLAQDADLVLNALDHAGEPRLQRVIDAAGVFYACVLVDAHATPATPTNPQGRLAVEIANLTLTVSEDALDTKPLLLEPAVTRIGAQTRDKGGSSLQPVQFPVVEWLEYADPAPNFIFSSANAVEILRQGPGDTLPVLIATRAPSAESFTDPLQLLPKAAPARGGTTYRYFLRAVNVQGAAGAVPTSLLTVPMLAPQLPLASQDSPGGFGTTVNWQASDGARLYRILRGDFADGTGAVELGTAPSGQTSYSDTTGIPGAFYWYFVRSEGQGDGRSSNGLEAGALSPPSNPAQGLRGVVLRLGCTTAGVQGEGTAANPYLVEAGAQYQFQALDQLANDLTIVSTFAVDPAASAQFAGQPGLLGGIAPGPGSFVVNCTYSFAGFTWTAKAHCRIG